MSNIKVVVSMFFDKSAVTNRVDREKIKVLSKFGAFVRTRSQSSLRRSKNPSRPGRPPHSHTGILKRFIYFSYDPHAESVVIGPAKTNQKFFDHDGEPVADGTVPEVLEYGGSITIREIQVPESFGGDIGGKWIREDLRFRGRSNSWRTSAPRRLRTVQIAARPFMGPAFRAELPKASGLWANSIK